MADVTFLTPATITKATTLQTLWCFTVFQHYVLLDGHVLWLLVVLVGFCSSDSSLAADVSSSKMILVFQSDRSEGKVLFLSAHCTSAVCGLCSQSLQRFGSVCFFMKLLCFFSMSLLLYFTLFFHSHTL